MYGIYDAVLQISCTTSTVELVDDLDPLDDVRLAVLNLLTQLLVWRNHTLSLNRERVWSIELCPAPRIWVRLQKSHSWMM